MDQIMADEALWSAQFEATNDKKLAALAASVDFEISEGKTMAMFDDFGAFGDHEGYDRLLG